MKWNIDFMVSCIWATSSPERFSMALEVGSQGKAPWGRGWYMGDHKPFEPLGKRHHTC